MSKNCLIIDDSNVIRNVVERILNSHNIAVTQAENAATAIEYGTKNPHDVIILDWDLVGRNDSSIELIKTLRANESAEKKSTIIYMTTEMDVAAMTKAKRAGADAFFMKPFDRTQLENKFKELGLAA